jgi:hypothetical protein
LVAALADSHPIFARTTDIPREPVAWRGGPARITEPDRATFRRRRLLAVGLLLLLVAAALATVQAALAGTGGGPLTTTGAAASRPASAQIWIVRPGDTLWSIARAIDPKGDPRALVDSLARRTGGAGLYPGERISLPAR